LFALFASPRVAAVTGCLSFCVQFWHLLAHFHTPSPTHNTHRYARAFGLRSLVRLVAHAFTHGFGSRYTTFMHFLPTVLTRLHLTHTVTHLFYTRLRYRLHFVLVAFGSLPFVLCVCHGLYASRSPTHSLPFHLFTLRFIYTAHVARSRSFTTHTVWISLVYFALSPTVWFSLHARSGWFCLLDSLTHGWTQDSFGLLVHLSRTPPGCCLYLPSSHSAVTVQRAYAAGLLVPHLTFWLFGHTPRALDCLAFTIVLEHRLSHRFPSFHTYYLLHLALYLCIHVYHARLWLPHAVCDNVTLYNTPFWFFIHICGLPHHYLSAHVYVPRFTSSTFAIFAAYRADLLCVPLNVHVPGYAHCFTRARLVTPGPRSLPRTLRFVAWFTRAVAFSPHVRVGSPPSRWLPRTSLSRLVHTHTAPLLVLSGCSLPLWIVAHSGYRHTGFTLVWFTCTRGKSSVLLTHTSPSHVYVLLSTTFPVGLPFALGSFTLHSRLRQDEQFLRSTLFSHTPFVTPLFPLPLYIYVWFHVLRLHTRRLLRLRLPFHWFSFVGLHTYAPHLHRSVICAHVARLPHRHTGFTHRVTRHTFTFGSRFV